MSKEIEWHDGYPDKRGLYKCMVDGKEQFLVCHRCDITGKARWSDVRGYDIVGCQIKYSAGPLKAHDIQNL